MKKSSFNHKKKGKTSKAKAAKANKRAPESEIQFAEPTVTDTQYFFFAIGPVQVFVAQSRRSKDLWSGSFLLSWLSAVAMEAARTQAGCSILYPKVEQRFSDAITKGFAKRSAEEGADVEQAPKQGSIPNRFTAQIQPSANFNPKLITEAVGQAWRLLCDLVWQRDIQPFLKQYGDKDLHKGVTEVWRRQTEKPFDIHWEIRSKQATDSLRERKYWRNHYQQPEPGPKCMIMVGRQDLSGMNQAGGKHRQFWNRLREHVGKTDLEENESISAVAFVKRRLVNHFAHLDGQVHLAAEPARSFPLKGWSFTAVQESTGNSKDYNPNHVPSLPYISALPFLQQCLCVAQDDPGFLALYQGFCDQAFSVFGDPSVSVSLVEHANDNQRRRLTSMDGVAFFPKTFTTDKHMGVKQEEGEPKKQLQRAFNQLRDYFKTETLSDPSKERLIEPSPFYALLLMDGDSLGKQLLHQQRHIPLSHALNAFNQAVPGIVARHNGFLCYCGGDDVLALLPLDNAIACANALRLQFTDCIQAHKGDSGLNSSLSGAIHFAHMKTPLLHIIDQSHHLLDQVAKNQTGRNALAIQVTKPGGQHCQWSMPWEQLYPADITAEMGLLHAPVLAAKGQGSGVGRRQLSSKLLFKLMDLLEQTQSQPLDMATLKKLALAEYLHSGEQLKSQYSQLELSQANSDVEALLALCQKFKHSQAEQVEVVGINPDALKLVRFLATKGLGKEDKD